MLFYRSFGIFISLLVIAGCGFEPIFKAVGMRNTNNELRYIEIKAIENRIGQQLRNRLVKDIMPLGRKRDVKYALNVTLTESKANLAIKKSEIATRANLIFFANYKLTLKSNGKELTSGGSRMVTSYNILTETFGTQIAEKDARNRAVREISADIASKIIIYFNMVKKNSDKID